MIDACSWLMMLDFVIKFNGIIFSHINNFYGFWCLCKVDLTFLGENVKNLVKKLVSGLIFILMCKRFEGMAWPIELKFMINFLFVLSKIVNKMVKWLNILNILANNLSILSQTPHPFQWLLNNFLTTHNLQIPSFQYPMNISCNRYFDENFR